MPTTTRSKTFNPYQPFSSPSDECTVTTQVNRADYIHIRQLRLGMGTVGGTIGHLWKQLCYELRKRNITNTTNEPEFESFMSDFRIITGEEYRELEYYRAGRVPNRPLREPVSVPGGHNDAGTTPGIRDEAAELSPDAPNLPSGCGVSGKDRKNKKGSGGKKG